MLNRIETSGKRGKVVVSYLLTFEEKGKTRSAYAPKNMVSEVTQWVEQLSPGCEICTHDLLVRVSQRSEPPDILFAHS